MSVDIVQQDGNALIPTHTWLLLSGQPWSIISWVCKGNIGGCRKHYNKQCRLLATSEIILALDEFEDKSEVWLRGKSGFKAAVVTPTHIAYYFFLLVPQGVGIAGAFLFLATSNSRKNDY